jgi:hypothetical protein
MDDDGRPGVAPGFPMNRRHAAIILRLLVEDQFRSGWDATYAEESRELAVWIKAHFPDVFDAGKGDWKDAYYGLL